MSRACLCGALVLIGCGATTPAPSTPTTMGATTVIPTFGPRAGLTLPAPITVAPYVEPTITLTAIDAALLTKLGLARSLEAAAGASARERSTAWDAVATHAYAGGENPYATFAAARAKAWGDAASIEDARRSAQAELLSAYRGDYVALGKLVARATPAQADEAETRFATAYGPWEKELATLELGALEPLPTPIDPKKQPPRAPQAPLADPLGPADVIAQRVVIKADAGAHFQTFSVDTPDDDISALRGQKPTYDLSGFFAGGEASVNVADVSGFAVGLLLAGRYHVTTQLPDSSFVSGSSPSETVVPAEDGPTGAFVAGGGVRLSGNLLPRIGMELGLTGGFTQFLAPSLVPGCGPDPVSWDPALRGFQGDLFAGAEFYPLALLSFGVAGKVGFGHVSGEWCVPAASTTDVDAPMDVSADAFSVSAQGSIGLHF